MMKLYYYEDMWDVHFKNEIVNGFKQLFNIDIELHHKLKWDVKYDIYRLLKRCLILVNDVGDFAIINHHDRCNSHDIFRDMIKWPECKLVLQCQYREHTILDSKIKPFVYLEKDPSVFRKVGFFREKLGSNEKLYFRGKISATDLGRKRREVLPFLGGILNSSVDRIEFNKFIDELCGHRLALCIPGNGNFCHRDIECFALGVPVLMPRYLNKFYYDMIPDYHYVSVSCNWELDDPKELADKLLVRYSDVIGDVEFLNFIRVNARAWYEANVLTPGPARLLYKLIDGVLV